MPGADVLQWVGVLIVTALGGGTFGVLGVKWLNRPVDQATADKLQAEAKSTAQQTVTAEVQTLRDVLSEVRANDAAKTQRLDELDGRIRLLEERERHMLTRAAVHEAWDRMSFSALLAQNPQHPPPPPLTGANQDEHL